jgi:hypothetical protein
MWDKVAVRQHRPEKVFASEFNGEARGEVEYMIHGALVLNMKNGDESKVTWAARAALREHEGRLRYSFYQVWLHR